MIEAVRMSRNIIIYLVMIKTYLQDVVIGLWQRILIMVILIVRLFLLQLKERCLIGMKV